jgi:cytochrome d ubiquinol oxidase subunit II
MLGSYITGFSSDLWSLLFAVFAGFALSAGYMLLGAGWLIIKAEGALQQRAVKWARSSLWLTALGVAAVSIVTPMISARIFVKWFTFPHFFLLLPIPLLTAVLFIAIEWVLRRLPAMQAAGDDRWCWLPFAGAAGIFTLAFSGLAYSLFPYLVVDRIDIWQAASAPESLEFLLVGTSIVLPAILFYTIYAYRVFRGKAQPLMYY